jgi:hypothetical protein
MRTLLSIAAALLIGLASAQQGTNYAALKRISDQAQQHFFTSRAAAVMRATREGLPIHIEDRKTGQISELISFEPSGLPVYLTDTNINAALTTRATRLLPGGSTGLGLTGSGVMIGQWEGSIPRSTHQEIVGRTSVGDGSVTHGSHATWVACALIGTGVSAARKGMAPSATVFSCTNSNDISEISAAVGGLPMRLSNHSYTTFRGWINGDLGMGSGWYWLGDTAVSQTEDYHFGFYDDRTRSFDDIAYNAPFYLMVHSAGNDRGEGPTSQPTGWYRIGSTWFVNATTRDKDGGVTGYDTINNVQCGKNVLSIGAVDDILNYTGPASVPMTNFSTFGPTDDGRIKPDLVANGVNLSSADNTSDSAYISGSGTSGSAPNVTGSLALLVQHYRNTHAGADMRSATLKALAIHTADECGTSTGPDYRFGWGLMNSEAAADVITKDGVNPNVMRELSLADGATYTTRVTTEGGTPLRFTIGWTDPAGTPPPVSLDPTNPMLVNDLDIRVTKDGSTYFPYVLNPASPAAAATTGDNFRDNIEVVDIPAPPAGTYLVTVTHKGALAGGNPQFFSLIVTGARHDPRMTAFSINGTWITGTNSTNGLVTLNQAAPVGGLTVYPRFPATFTINSPIVVPAGQATKSFVIKAISPVVANTPYSIFVDSGYDSFGVAGTLVPVRIATLTVAPNPVASGTSATMTVGLNGPAPAGGITLDITRSPTFWVLSPATITIPAGQASAAVAVPIRAGAPAISNARLTVTQTIAGGGTVSLSKLFDITP